MSITFSARSTMRVIDPVLILYTPDSNLSTPKIKIIHKISPHTNTSARLTNHQKQAIQKAFETVSGYG